MATEVGWRALPFQGELRELRILGDGKDAFLQVHVPNGSAFAIPLNRGLASVACGDGVVVDTRGDDDDCLTITYRPSAGRRMRVVGARVNYPGTEADWESDAKIWEQMSRAKWPRESHWPVFGLELTLATWTDSDSADDIAK
jgi:hypothetical protein